MAKHAKPAGKRKYLLALALAVSLSFSGTFSAMALWKDAANAPGIKVQTETFRAMGIWYNGAQKNLFSKSEIDDKECSAVAIPMNSFSASGKPFKVNLDISPKKPGYRYSFFPVDYPDECQCWAANGRQKDIPSTAKYACVVAKVTGIGESRDAGTYSNVGTVTGMDESGNEVKAEDTWSAYLVEKSRDGEAVTAKVNLYRDDVRCSK